EIINSCVAAVNEAGRAFYDYASDMFLQTAVLVAVLLCVDRLLRKRIRATIRYWIWMLIFVKLILPPSLCVPTGIGYWLDREEQSPAPAAVPQTISIAESAAPVMTTEIPPVVPAVQPVELPATVVEPPEPVAADLVSLTWQGGILLVWIAGMLVFVGLVIQRWRFVKRLLARSEPASEDWVDVLDQCRRRMNVRGRVSLRLLPDACSPAVCGLLRPTILAPRALLDRLPVEGLQAVLIHELAHVKRGDLWVNSLQTILQAAYFYNPLVWLASAIVRRVREQAVDEMTLVALGAEAKSYGNTLIDIAEMAFLRPSPALRLIGVAESRKSLEGRLRHMMTRPIPKSARVGAMGALVIAAVGAVLLPMARAQNRTDTGSPHGEYKILLLDDRDPESRDKDAYDDRLYLMDSKGRIEGAVTGFNIAQSPGGCHVLAVDERRKTLWVVENVGDRLWHFDLADGKLLHQVPLPRVKAVAVDTATGDVWTVSGDQVGDERPLRVVSPAGQLVATYPIGGYDIAYSDCDDSFWVVGKRVTKIGKDGKVLCQLADEVSWLTVCVSVDQTTGTAWVVVRDNPSIAGSKPELLAVDKNGRLQQRIDLGDLLPFSVAVDSDNGIVWVGCRGTTLRYTTQGEKLKSARFADGFSIVPGASRNSVVAASNFDLAWATVADTGRVDVGFPPIDVRRDLLSSSQKWVAKVPWAGAKLLSSPELARLTMDKDAHLKLADYPESKAKLEVLGKALLMYANDYEDKLPDTPEGVRSFVGDADLKWFQDNVEYLGKGRNIADRPDLVVAYDKTVLRKGEGTLVLYLDSRVVFEGAHKLETLGIAAAAGTAVRQDNGGEASRGYGVDRSVAASPEGMAGARSAAATSQNATGTVSQPAAAPSSGSLPNLFVMAPSETGFGLFNAVGLRVGESVGNRTGRSHSKETYDEIFNGTHRRTDHDVLLLLFALDSESRIPSEYEDLLPKPWPQVEGQLRQGQVVELGGQARGLNVILLATPKAEQLKQAIAESRLLGNSHASADLSGRSIFHKYPVARSVADFPPGEDFSTPEAAYATINRIDYTDSSAWQKVSVARLAARMAQSGSESKKNVDPEWAKVLANARIKEVLVWNMTKAMVIAELPQDLSSKKIVDPFDVRFLGLENGRWLNMGNDRVSSVEAAEAHFKAWMERDAAEAAAMRDPLAHAAEIQAAAVQLFDKLRAADYAEILSHYHNGKWDSDAWRKFPTMGLYTVHTDYPSFILWCATHFKDNPIIGVQLGDVFISDALVADKTGRPTVPYRVTLKDGSVLAGNLPFEYETNNGKGHWNALEGIDWHLWPNATK
ncbi:MAG: M56 family metallopeptidase, partial [Solirubrobacterales bacterium]